MGAGRVERIQAAGKPRQVVVTYLSAWGTYEVDQVWELVGLGIGATRKNQADLLSEMSGMNLASSKAVVRTLQALKPWHEPYKL